MYFEAEIDLIQHDVIQGLLAVCKEALGTAAVVNKARPEQLEKLLAAHALIEVTLEANGMHIPRSTVTLTGTWREDYSALLEYISHVQTSFKSTSSKLKLKALSTQYAVALGAGFAYEFSQGDLDRVQSLINELRTNISASSLFEPKHKERLLARLERLQADLHKKVSDLDRFWGLVGDAGVILGKFGEDAKPFVDRIREIADIVWRTQARREELPSAAQSPVLPPPAGSNNEI